MDAFSVDKLLIRVKKMSQPLNALEIAKVLDIANCLLKDQISTSLDALK